MEIKYSETARQWVTGILGKTPEEHLKTEGDKLAAFFALKGYSGEEIKTETTVKLSLNQIIDGSERIRVEITKTVSTPHASQSERWVSSPEWIMSNQYTATQNRIGVAFLAEIKSQEKDALIDGLKQRIEVLNDEVEQLSLRNKELLNESD